MVVWVAGAARGWSLGLSWLVVGVLWWVVGGGCSMVWPLGVLPGGRAVIVAAVVIVVP
ncbi:hypothetical protein [Streptomyces canus]|uniref:hypothetical protein n=1 Tax=Streptomyces canus TaxID=58343 RepID=UPI0037138F57